MKRSKVLDKIEEIIVNNRYNEDMWSEEIALEVLNYLENEAGMLPPKIYILPETYNRSDGSYGFESNEWEPE